MPLFVALVSQFLALQTDFQVANGFLISPGVTIIGLGAINFVLGGLLGPGLSKFANF